jgi:hypothetical protein
MGQAPFLLLLLLALVLIAEGQLTHKNKIFLGPHETYLFFPHRHFRSISTYTSNCSARPPQLALEHAAMTSVASFSFNNSNLGISILS